MSTRTCPVCGKAIGRMRVGTDGEFCSREHRNQYRLRRSMDQLQEANVVASLMRRREQFKSLVSNPISGGGRDRHMEHLPRLARASNGGMTFRPAGAGATGESGGTGLQPAGAVPFRLSAPPAQRRAAAIASKTPGPPILMKIAPTIRAAGCPPPSSPQPLALPAPGVLLRVSAAQRFPVGRMALRAVKMPPPPARRAPQLRTLAGVRPGSIPASVST